ncbi:MAG: hypothetical protein B7Y43_13790 [Sphingomonas sp. 28-62-20]|uniref:DUF1345 domain-containing protein n=1 Tax=Sphingomonas sp. 28-62-20 TaxID=1970433 RepID=UPI000BDB0814|nr:MAG: hypothetical protein B7Y43_13790 [Sphingomonas sp. 28-62-20]
MNDQPETIHRQRIVPPRFLLFCAALAIGLAALIPILGPALGMMTAFDIAAGLFLVVVVPLLDSKASEMRIHARNNDANRAVLLAISLVVMLVILASVASEMPSMKSTITVALVVATLVLSWLFSNTIWALHYANLFYTHDDKGNDKGGLRFPGCAEPNYWDFAYFSFTLGMTFQTSDVEITRTSMRGHVTAHCLAAFIFNIGVLAFSINVLGGG